MHKPVIAITMGDPAGIGPELVVKVLAEGDLYQSTRPFVIGDPRVMAKACRLVGAPLTFQRLDDLSQARFRPGQVEVLQPAGLEVGEPAWGVLDPAMGRAVALCLKEAATLATDGRVAGIVSAPLNKEAFHMAGYDYPDELAYLAELTGSSNTFMMGVMRDAVWMASLAEHIPFRQIAAAITRERVLWYTVQMDGVLRRVGTRARIAVAALNVHGGEGGLFGREELDEIGPAIDDACARGIDAQGPIPADTVFVRALAGEFDGVVCMYHDQGNIARKLQPMDGRATFFIGLPVPCGTTAHGTAYDKAGLGIAEPGSLRAALRHTVALAGHGWA